MFSNAIKTALERELVGQVHAINGVVTGVTRVASGLLPRERRWCAYMLVGPTGTGKSQLVQTLARALHGDASRAVIADCSQTHTGEPWNGFAEQIAPLFAAQGGEPGGPVETPPLSILQIEYVERGPDELVKTLAAALGSGQLRLPGGRLGLLRNCIVFLTSGLCSREILDESTGIGFSATHIEEEEEHVEHERLHELCREQVEQKLGSELVSRLDGILVFHKLEEEHLVAILERRLARLNRWLAQRGLHAELMPAARDYLVDRGRGDLRLGARNLVRAHRRFVEFPVADLLISGRIPPGGRLVADRRAGEDHLHFSIDPGAAPGAHAFRNVPIA